MDKYLLKVNNGKTRAAFKNVVVTWKGFSVLFLFISSDTDIMSQSVDVLKDIISAHDIDSRFDSPECRSRIAALYLPLMAIAMEALPMLHGYESEKDDLINENVAMAIATSSVLQKQSSADLTSVSSQIKCGFHFFNSKKKLPLRKLSPVKVVNKIFQMCTIRFLNSEQGVHDI